MADYKIKNNEFDGFQKNKILSIVIFTGGQAPAPENTAKYWCSPLVFGKERAPDFVIAADSGLETLREYQNYFGEKDTLFRQAGAPFAQKIDFSPDLIVGDFDSLSDPKILALYPDEIIEKTSTHKDLTDTELALCTARKNFKNAFVTLVGGAGGRTDHFLGIYDLFGTDLAPDAWLCGEQILFNAQRRKFFVEGVQLGAPLAVARAASMPKGGKILSRGLEWEYKVFRKRGMPSISNTISLKYFNEKRPVEFYFKRGKFVLILPLDSIVTCG